VSEPNPRGLRRFTKHDRKLPSERDWKRSILLEPRPGPRDPALVSDGGGLPFPLAALAGAAEALDADDPAVAALSRYLADPKGPQYTASAPWKRGSPAPALPQPSLDGWRLLARTDDEALFGHGRPPQLRTVAVRQDGRRRPWAPAGSSAGKQLRAAREQIRASSWRLDPTQAPQPEDTVLRVLVTEQTFASGQRADRRVLVPDIYADENEIVLTMFVKPRPGFQTGDRNPETPVRVALAEPFGTRQLIDGAVAQYSPWARPNRASSS
jgi:hypothetical protein